ncbi:MAG: hypothetical protein GXP35_05025 [Actinobacteria bacterium]|nr:hypothetical protein [Actinomycetota bacterium]
MAGERSLDVVHDVGSVDTANIDRRPSWIMVGVGAMVALVVVVSVATRENQRPVNDGSLPVATEPDSVPTSVSPEPPESPEPAPSPAGGDLDSDRLSLNEGVPASLPPGGIDGWMFSLDGLSRLTRTDLTTGEESRISLRDEQRSEFEFILSQSRLAQIGDKVVWASPDRLYVVDIETLDVSEPFALDPLTTGAIVGGAANGVLRYSVPFGGAWELEAGTYRRLDVSIVTGSNGGTLEVRCATSPDDCTTIIHDISTGEDTRIESDSLTLGLAFGPVLSPALDAVATFGSVTYTDGTVIDLPRSGKWTWSRSGRFVTSNHLIVVDLAGEHAPFQIPPGDRGPPRQEAFVVLRSDE